jgi:NADH-quinone oxidoreductase subunit J
VLFLFVIMLLGVDNIENLRRDPLPIQRPVALVVGLGTVTLVTVAVLRTRDTMAEGEALDASGDSNVRLLARNLFSDQVLAFELTSVLLIVAIAGTVLLTRRPPKDRS